ncbi:hypothetical protein [Rubritalea marina]|uniref:HzsA-related protein n=1 Tax=Rubritalea marina TaxID=361055 RepID=UPI00035EB146|nr:hypothetical protein [Rubritalea marina]
MHHLHKIFITSLALCSSAVASPDWSGFQKALDAIPEEYNKMEAVERAVSYQKAFFQLSLDFPILTDWVLQDGGKNSWLLVIPENRGQILRAMFKSHGQTSIGSLEDYVKLCEARRAKRLGKAVKQWAPFVFTESDTIRNSFFGYTEGLSDARTERFFSPGSRLTQVDFKPDSTYVEAETLINDPHGMMRDVDVSFDKQKLLFSWKKSDRLDDYHVYEYDLKTTSAQQLTFGLGRADYEPVYLPDGEIMFVSTRAEHSVPCFHTDVSNLYRMDGKGRYVRRLAIDQVHTIYPIVLSNGRVAYTRWDYSDRGQVYPHPVFTMDPDGQGQRAYYGANSWFPTSLLHTRPIPGSDKVMSIASGHHTTQNGKLTIVDVSKGRNEGHGLELVAPRRDHGYVAGEGTKSPVVKDMWGQDGDQFRYPFPLSEEECLISYQPDYGFRANWYTTHRHGLKGSHHYGLYWMNMDGERELLFRAQDMGVGRMVSLTKKAQVETIADTVDYTKENGTYYVHDVYEGLGLKGIKRGEAKKLRVVEIDYRAAGVGGKFNGGPGGGSLNTTPISIGNATWDVKKILGDVDIHEDGSVMFDVPAMVSQYHQILNDKGQVIQTTRTWDTLRPGERKSCVGCHEPTNANFHEFENDGTMAWQQSPQQLQPFYGKTRGFSFVKEVQPILDRSCVQCHDGSQKDRMDLRGIPVQESNMNKRKWSKSYINLTGAKLDKHKSFKTNHPEAGIVSWISQMSQPDEIKPYFAGAATSPLVKMLEDGHQGVELSEEDLHKIYAWIDLLVPFSGDYHEESDWLPHETQYYNYYEKKRKDQYEEEQQNIKDLMADNGKHPVENENTEAFTRAFYRPVFDKVVLQPNENKQIMLDQFPVALIDTLNLSTDAKHPVGVELRRKHTKELVLGLQVQPGEVLQHRFEEPYNTGRFYLELSHPGVELTVEQAYGVLEEELPGGQGNHRHMSKP